MGPCVSNVTLLDQRRSVGPLVGFWLVSNVFQGGFMVFYGFWLFSMVFQGSFMAFHGFSWFLVGFHGFSRFPGGFSLSLMVPGWLNPS